jgi:deoxyribonuclease IV
MVMLGAHMSIAGGFHKAVDRAATVGCNCVQIFTAAPQQWQVQATKTTFQSGGLLTKNNNQWRAKEIAADDAARFQAALAEGRVSQPLSHSSYLINLASGNEELWEKSVTGMMLELTRAEQLGIEYVVLHPGAHTGIEEEAGIQNVIRAIDAIHARLPEVTSKILLETTAGQGTCLGHRFEQLAAMLQGVKAPERLGVCIDTCHIFAAGYPLIERTDYLATFRQFEKVIGLPFLRAFHLNDSKKPLGSRVDRHEHIGEGALGLQPFQHLLNDDRFRQIPMYLETPKGTRNEEDLDAINLRTLRSLMK